MLFVTGTDTGVGKTHFCTRLIRQLRINAVDAVGFKPLCCGDRDDVHFLTAASDEVLSENECNPVWMRFPAAPYTASLIEERAIDLEQIHDQLRQLRNRFSTIIVEGAGGWCVPIRRDYTMANLARELGFPVLLVAMNRLGVLNHTLLTVQAIQSAGLQCAGVILNNRSDDGDPVLVTNRSVLEDILTEYGVPVLGEMEPEAQSLDTITYGKIRSIFTEKNSLPDASE